VESSGPYCGNCIDRFTLRTESVAVPYHWIQAPTFEVSVTSKFAAIAALVLATACDGVKPSTPVQNMVPELRMSTATTGTRFEVVFPFIKEAGDEMVVTSFEPFPRTICTGFDIAGRISGVFTGEGAGGKNLSWSSLNPPPGTKFRLVEFHHFCSEGAWWTAEII
jgi:hypothetical protein